MRLIGQIVVIFLLVAAVTANYIDINGLNLIGIKALE